MKAFFLVVSLLLIGFSSQAQSNPPLFLPQTKVFKGDIKILIRQTMEKVFVSAPEGKKRQQELQSQGFNCLLINSGLSQCTRLDHPAVLPQEESQKVFETFEQAEIRFLAGENIFDLLWEGEEMAEWMVYNHVEFGGTIYQMYRLMKNTDGWFLRLGKPNSSDFHSFYLNADGDLVYSYRLSSSIKNGQMTYWLGVVFH